MVSHACFKRPILEVHLSAQRAELKSFDKAKVEPLNQPSRKELRLQSSKSRILYGVVFPFAS